MLWLKIVFLNLMPFQKTTIQIKTTTLQYLCCDYNIICVGSTTLKNSVAYWVEKFSELVFQHIVKGIRLGKLMYTSDDIRNRNFHRLQEVKIKYSRICKGVKRKFNSFVCAAFLNFLFPEKIFTPQRISRC